ncbi:hypothetical protein GCM10009836_61160 [Pseudonocardia ailaonensis]|uniref:Extradiol ring-cleavage dioxygenase class III enzyme subunit B domain-containing protein n=1 Tax=Pseudonocardia ailaonensis TaxID=367279 RepID=A0ABN2NJI0_9PSEU
MSSDLIAVAGSSHSPMLSSEGRSIWQSRAESDRNGSTELIDVAGRRWAYDDLLAGGAGAEPDVDRWLGEHLRARTAMARLGKDLEALDLDLAVIVGDDQLEMFDASSMPAIALYSGPEVPLEPLEGMPAPLREAFRDLGNDGSVRQGDPDAAVQLVRSLTESGIDITVVGGIGSGRAIGHAYGAIAKQLVPDPSIRIVPVFLNTYYEPNQPTPRRCHELGAALRRAIEALAGNRRVAVIASGGLSHFIVDQELDHLVLAAMENGDHERLQQLATPGLESGTSEIRNWVCAAGAIGDLGFRWSEYVPVVRTAAGTGTGLAFALWSAEARAEPREAAMTSGTPEGERDHG